jgi:hypothetical protein
MSSSSSDEWEQPSAAAVRPIRKKRNISVVEHAEGESNVKGFASAFATIMDRPQSELIISTREAETTSANPEKKGPREEKRIVGHVTEPVIASEMESTFEVTAERGVVKLFKAVAMHRKRVIETEASKGIGVTKNGQIRRLRRPITTEDKSKSMSSFLDALRKAKTSK